jgi:hypothetical protein
LKPPTLDFDPLTTVIHAAVDPLRRRTPESQAQYCREKIVELDMTREQLGYAVRERNALANALQRIESGELSNGSLVDPNAQQFAAETLAQLTGGELRKVGA